jgi:uncharacterized protein YkwD
LPVRRALAAILALPVLAAVYLTFALRRGPATRISLGLGLGGFVAIAAIGIPAGTIGSPPATQPPLAASALGPVVATGRDLAAAMIIDFDAPMDAASVAGATRVEPASDVRLGWSDDGMRLFVEPVGGWRAATYYTVTVGTAALDREGRPLASPLRAGFLTRQATTTQLAVTDRLESGVALDSSIALTFDRPVAVASVLRAFRITPAMTGQLFVASEGTDGADPTLAEAFLWEPEGLFTAQTEYTVALADGVVDAEGAAVTSPDALTFTTTKSPSVVRFRPRGGTEEIARDADVSVRFTMPMDRASTKKAFSVEVNGKTVDGEVWFAEDDTVLVLDPEADFPYAATVVLRVAGGAIAADGTPLDRRRSAAFTVEPKPEPTPRPTAASRGGATTPRATPRPAPRATTAPRTAPRPSSSSWVSAEKYLLSLMNCTRGGGWVLADGSCSSPGGSGIPALRYHEGVSDNVSRPYARKLAVNGACSHFYGGDPGDRLRAAGYTGYQWAENIGCRYFSDPRDAAVSLVRFFQSERSWSPVGPHYVNMMSRKYTHAGIGLWVAGGNLNFVVNFYTP